MRKRVLSIVLSVALMSGTAVQMCKAEQKSSVDVLTGYVDGNLHLERTLTRAEFAKIVCEVFFDGEKNPAPYEFQKFSDLPENHWGINYIRQAEAEGLINGFDDGTFRPEGEITYEQALAVIIRYLSETGNISEYGFLEYPNNYVVPAVENGIADGITAVIGESVTRGEIVKLLDNAVEYNLIRAQEKEDTIENNVFSYSHSAGGGSAGGSAPTAAVAYSSTAAMTLYEESYADFNTEEYTSNSENVFRNALTSPLSTFSIDTDTASYSNMRRFILQGQNIPNGSIRSEELINYFDYDNPLPKGDMPFSVSTETAACFWNPENKLVRIAVQGEELKAKKASNLVFLIDISGSMYSENKLPLVKKSLKLLLNELDDSDTVSIVTYASGVGVALESTPVSEKKKIIDAINSLFAYGATNGGEGINLAYEEAEKNLIDGNNRIILCSDGDFNIGKSSTGELEQLIEEKRDSGIFLTVLGFGMGNYKDNRMEILADKGNGSYAYIDNMREAKKVFVDEMPKTLYTIAKDVKIQVEFNPKKVKEYRLVGYENRVLNNEDFEDDNRDAGELGCGATVTALYEIVSSDGTEQSGLKYQTAVLNDSDDLMTVKIRYKEPDGDESKLIEVPVRGEEQDSISEDFKFSAAAAELGMILNNSEFKGNADYDSVIKLAKKGIGEDRFGFKTEFLHLVDILKHID